MGAAENKRIVQEMYARLAEGRLRPYLEPMADDLRLTIIGTTKYSGTFTGKATYEKFLRALPPLFEGRVPLLNPRILLPKVTTWWCSCAASPHP